MDNIVRSITTIIVAMVMCASSQGGEGPSTNSTDSTGSLQADSAGKPIDKASSSANPLRQGFEGQEAAADRQGRHLFILSGQSNMAKMDHDVSFAPAVEKAFGKGNVTVVRNAETGAPLLKWDKDYKWPEGRALPQGRKKPGKEEKTELTTGGRYDELMAAVKKHTEGKRYDTVTFVWMQGETDAGKKIG